MSQPEFSRLVGIAESTLAKIESLRLPLSKENAIRVTQETGISTSWLMEGDPMTPPIADEFRFRGADDKPVLFTEKLFAECRARHFSNIEVRVPDLDLHSMGAGAKKRGQQRLFSYKLDAAVAKLKEEFPIDAKEKARREQRIFRLRELEYELARAKRYVLQQFKKLTNKKDEESSPLFQALVNYGKAIGAIHPHDLPRDMRYLEPPQSNHLKRNRSKRDPANNPQPSA